MAPGTQLKRTGRQAWRSCTGWQCQLLLNSEALPWLHGGSITAAGQSAQTLPAGSLERTHASAAGRPARRAALAAQRPAQHVERAAVADPAAGVSLPATWAQRLRASHPADMHDPADSQLTAASWHARALPAWTQPGAAGCAGGPPTAPAPLAPWSSGRSAPPSSCLRAPICTKGQACEPQGTSNGRTGGAGQGVRKPVHLLAGAACGAAVAEPNEAADLV